MILAALLFIRRVAVTTTVSHVTSEFMESAREHALHDKHIPEEVAPIRNNRPSHAKKPRPGPIHPLVPRPILGRR